MAKVDSQLAQWFKTHDKDHTGRLNAEQLQTRVTNFEIEMTVLTRFPQLVRLGDGRSTTFDFQGRFSHFFHCPISSTQNVYTR